MSATRKYRLVSSDNCSACRLRRFTTKVRPRWALSDIELIAIESTSRGATSVNPLCTMLSTNEVPLPKIPILTFFFDGFDAVRFKLRRCSSDCNRLSDVHYA